MIIYNFIHQSSNLCLGLILVLKGILFSHRTFLHCYNFFLMLPTLLPSSAPIGSASVVGPSLCPFQPVFCKGTEHSPVDLCFQLPWDCQLASFQVPPYFWGIKSKGFCWFFPTGPFLRGSWCDTWHWSALSSGFMRVRSRLFSVFCVSVKRRGFVLQRSSLYRDSLTGPCSIMRALIPYLGIVCWDS